MLKCVRQANTKQSFSVGPIERHDCSHYPIKHLRAQRSNILETVCSWYHEEGRSKGLSSIVNSDKSNRCLPLE